MTDETRIKITADWLTDAPVKRVMECFADAGFPAYFVGGCVRNALLDLPVTDIDIATPATPDQVMELGRASHIKTLPTGIKHGTVSWILDGQIFQITTYRRDIKTDGRHAQVAFSDCMKTDAARRDFTMNALYADAAGTVFDPISGLDDLRRGRVRFIGDAGKRIAEDGLRILRFFRMSALYGADGGDKLDAAGLAACGAHGVALARLSQERISTEFRLLLSAPNPAPAILAMEGAGLLTRIITGCRADFITRFIDLETAVGARADWIFRLAILGGQGVAEGESCLRLSNAEKKSYTGVLSAVKVLDSGDSGIKSSALGYYHGAQIARAAVMYRAVQRGQNLDKAVLEQIDFGANQQNKYPIKAADLMDFAEGRELGDLLKKGERIWVQSNFTKTKEAVLLVIND